MEHQARVHLRTSRLFDNYLTIMEILLAGRCYVKQYGYGELDSPFTAKAR